MNIDKIGDKIWEALTYMMLLNTQSLENFEKNAIENDLSL